MLNRRTLLTTSAGAALHRLRHAVPLGLAFTPTAARAEVGTVVIATAAAVAGMIAANNRGSALGAYLNALHAKLDVTIEQLASLQDAMSKVLVKLSELTNGRLE